MIFIPNIRFISFINTQIFTKLLSRFYKSMCYKVRKSRVTVVLVKFFETQKREKLSSEKINETEVKSDIFTKFVVLIPLISRDCDFEIAQRDYGCAVSSARSTKRL